MKNRGRFETEILPSYKDGRMTAKTFSRAVSTFNGTSLLVAILNPPRRSHHCRYGVQITWREVKRARLAGVLGVRRGKGSPAARASGREWREGELERKQDLTFFLPLLSFFPSCPVYGLAEGAPFPLLLSITSFAALPITSPFPFFLPVPPAPMLLPTNLEEISKIFC